MRDIYSFTWINDYVKQAALLPDHLFSCHGKLPTAAEITAIHALVASRPNLILEIGAGSGQHLMGQAKRHSGLDYIGIEIRYKRSVRLAQKSSRDGIKNLFVIRADAECIEQLFAPQSIAGIFINFPDPWQRPKWKKHRLLSPMFLDRYASLLRPGGFIRLKTDHQEFFESSAKLINAHDAFTVIHHEPDLYQSALIGQNIPTEFEQLFRSKGQPIFFLECIRSVAQN